MPRRLEIRTTILEKKSDIRTRGKDANSNDLYADEALQLLEEIQQLKSNIQKTDEKILGTYVKSPSKRKKKSDVPARKVAYDVLYPAIDTAGSRVEEEKHGRRRVVRDTIVSHCLNAGGATAPDDVTSGRPWTTSCATHFTPAPVASWQFGEPSFRPDIRRRSNREQEQTSLKLVEEYCRPAFRHDGQQPKIATDDQPPSGGSQQLIGREGNGFKRIYATNRAATSNVHPVSDAFVFRLAGEITRGGSATGSSHDQRIEQRQQDPTAGGKAGGRGHAVDDGQDDDNEEAAHSPANNATADGENSRHAPMPLNATDLSDNLGPQWVDGAEVDESFQPVPPDKIEPEFGRPASAGLVEEQPAADQVDVKGDDLHDRSVPEEEQLIDASAAEGRDFQRSERTRHYDRDEIRQYMQKQRKERKEKIGHQSSAPVCHHSRISPMKRSDLGLPDKPVVQTKRKERAEAMARKQVCAEKPKSVGVCKTSLRPREEKKKKLDSAGSRGHKGIQTEPMAARQTIDEATQMSARSQFSDSSTDWLHTVPTATGATVTGDGRTAQQPAASQSTDQRLRCASSGVLQSSPRSQLLARDHPAVTAAHTQPKPVTKLIQKIEDLELYIGHLLEAPTFQAVQTASVHLLLPAAVERPRDIGPFASYRPSGPVELPTKLSPYRPPVSPTPVAVNSHPLSRTVTDGPTRVGQPTPPTRISSLKLEQFQLDTTASTEYHPLPDHLAAFLRLDSRRSRDGSPTVRAGPEIASQSKAESKHGDKRSRYVTEEATELSSLFQQQLSRHPEAAVAGQSDGRTKRAPAEQRPTVGGRQDEEPQTYFRDFNEILQMDPNPLTERSNSWKRIASRSVMPDGADAFPIPAAPYNILSALSDELKATMNRIPRASDHSSDSDFQSRLSVSDISVPDAVTKKTATDATANGRPGQPRASSSSSSVYSSSKTEIQVPKNGSGSRTGSRDAGSRMTNQADEHRQQVDAQSTRDVTDASLIPLELDTTYLTLTPQYTSFEATCSLAMPLDSTCMTESGLAAHQAANEANDRSMFSSKLSPIPRAVSPLALISDSDTSVIRTEQKQSTSSSDRSERDRSVGLENVVDDNTASLVQPPATSVQVRMKKSDDLLARLRAEIQRDESLYRSIQQVDRLEDSAAAKESSKRFRIQIDSETRSFIEAQTDALRSIAQEVRGGIAGNATVFLQASQAAMEVDRVHNRQVFDSGGRQTYSSDFDEPSIRTEIPSESQPAKSTGPNSPKRSLDCGSDYSERGGLDSSDASVLPPKAVDILLQEEAKQQRLLLKLREKAQVEKTLAELELLQMQKRILRAQGERGKAASIKKKQRGLLLKLQEERSRIEALRRQHKKEEQRSKASCDYQHYDSSSWETDVSAMSNSTVGAGDTSASVVGEAAQAADSSSATSTLRQVLSEAAHVQQLSSNDEAVDDDVELSHQLSRSELEGHDPASALSSVRLRAPLSPRTTTENIRIRSKFLRRRHSSGSDDSINLSQNETASDVSDVESRLLALNDQLRRRQTEAKRLKTEHNRLSKEKRKAQESALIKQIEVYDRCITDLRSQLDADAETGATANAVLAVRPVIRQPRALIRTDGAQSPTSGGRSESESAKSLEAEGHIPPAEQKEEHSSGTSSISAQVHTEADESMGQLSEHESIREPELVDDKDVAVLPAIESAESEKSLSELSTDPSATQENQAETSDCARADVFNQTMIIKSDVQVKEELAEDISKFILDQLIEETVALTSCCILKKKKKAEIPASNKSSADVLQRVSALLSTGTDAPKGNRCQLYLTTTFDIFSPDDVHSPVAHPAGSPSGPPCDVSSAEGRDALESKLNELRIENEWIDDDLQPVPSDSVVADENRDKVIQEAEALEREQKRIEQEIQRLSSGSVLYLREIPNKPPPPYTPPGQALTWQKIRSPVVAENQQIIPKSKEDVARCCRRFTEYLLDHDAEPDVHFPDELLTYDRPLQADQPAECQVNCRAFLSLLADLSRLHLTELRKQATFLANQKCMGGRPIRSRTELVKAVESAVLVQMNYQPRLLRESQLARWSQKKRDRVDEILVRELQIEEKFWTDFSSEEVQVKHQTADAILDMLLDETASICNRMIMQAAK